MTKVKPVFALASWFVLFPGVSLGKYNDKDTIHRNKVWMDDEICTIFYHLHFQKWEGMTSMMLRKGFLRTRRHFQCSLSFHLSLSSDCCFCQNKIFLQLFDKCFSLVRSGNALQNLALWKDRTPFHTTPSKNMREKHFLLFLSFIFSFSGNAALYGKCILSYHLLPLLANCTAPPAPQFVISRR